MDEAVEYGLSLGRVSKVDVRGRTIAFRASRATNTQNTSQGGQNSVSTDGQFSVVTTTHVSIAMARMVSSWPGESLPPRFVRGFLACLRGTYGGVALLNARGMRRFSAENGGKESRQKT